MTDARGQDGLSAEELSAEGATALPDKEVVSILDLNADVNLAIDAAAPIDLAGGANANVAAPINAAAGANIDSFGSQAQALGDQGAAIDQHINADANATSDQTSGIDQASADPVTDPTPATDGTSTTVDTSQAALDDGNLLNVDVNVDLDSDIAAPINGAVAANANIAAP